MELKKKEFLLGWTGNEGTLRGPRGPKNIYSWAVGVVMVVEVRKVSQVGRSCRCRSLSVLSAEPEGYIIGSCTFYIWILKVIRFVRFGLVWKSLNS